MFYFYFPWQFFAAVFKYSYDFLSDYISFLNHKTDLRIKVVEKTGNTLKRDLQKASVSEKKECDDRECKIFETSKVKGLCRKEGVTYEIVCKACKEKYIGESGRSAWARVNEHVYEYRMKKESSVL